MQHEFKPRRTPLIVQSNKEQLNSLCRVSTYNLSPHEPILYSILGDVPESTAPASSSKSISAGPAPRNRTPNQVASTSTAQPPQPVPPAPPKLAPPAPPKPAPTPKPKPTLSDPQSRPPINLINSVLQKAYNSNKVPLSKTSQTWDLPNYLTGTRSLYFNELQ